MNEQDALIHTVLRAAIPAIAGLIDAVAAGMNRGGRLIYVGAGTSGRLGVLDASECPPTFCTSPRQVVGIIAGGDPALRRSSEGKEDDPQGAVPELETLEIDDRDTVIGIAAGGTTPYVHGALQHAKAQGSTVGLITCVRADAVQGLVAELPGLHLIALPVGPEVVAGSTRLKAGTATKLALNMISTATMVRLGKVWGNLMVDLRATNAKLRDRAARILMSQTSLSRDAALSLLNEAGGSVKLALVMALARCGIEDARRRLEAAGGQLRLVLGPPR